MYCDKQELQGAIREHLQVHGARNWSVLRLRYGGVSDATWWRSVRQVKADMKPVTAELEPRQSAMPAGPNGRMLGLRSVLGPVHLVANGGPRHIDYLSAFSQLNDGIEQLRSYALNSKSEIRYPAIFERAMKMKVKFVSQCVHWTERIYSLHGQQAFYDAVVAEVVAEAPDIQHRIINRLERLLSSDQQQNAAPSVRPLSPSVAEAM